MKKQTTQKTPKGHSIAIPKRGDVLKLFKKAATHQFVSTRDRLLTSSTFDATPCRNPVGLAKIIAAIPKVAEYSNLGL